MNDDTVILRIEKIVSDDPDRTYGVAMEIEGVTVYCKKFHSTQENAMACYRALKVASGEDEDQWRSSLVILTFEAR